MNTQTPDADASPSNLQLNEVIKSKPIFLPSNKSIDISLIYPDHIMICIDSFLYRSFIRKVDKYNARIEYDKSYPIISPEYDTHILNLIADMVGDISFEYRKKSKKGILRLRAINEYCLYHNYIGNADDIRTLPYNTDWRKKISKNAYINRYKICDPLVNPPNHEDIGRMKYIGYDILKIDDMGVRSILIDALNISKALMTAHNHNKYRIISIRNHLKTCYNCYPFVRLYPDMDDCFISDHPGIKDGDIVPM